MFQKTTVREKGRISSAADSENKQSGNGKSLPAVQGKFDTVQRAAPEEELQMKADPVQKMEGEETEGEELQMKADPVQKMEGEETEGEELQMKADPVQKMEGDETEGEELQMKADPVQKMEGEETEGEELQMKADPLQKMGEEEEPVQGKFETIQKAGDEEDPMQLKRSPVQRFEATAAANKTGMPNNLKSGIESLSGFSMDDVKVHYNSDKPKQLKALAYAQGTDIHIAPGQEKHLPHEAWHVAQQKQGRVQPTVQMKAGVPVNDDPGLEKEADEMGAKAIQSKADPSFAPSQLKFNSSLLSRRPAQRKVVQREDGDVPTMTRGRASRNVVTDTPDSRFARENAGIVNMIGNAGGVLSKVKWGDIAANTDTVGAVTGAGGAVGGVTGLAGTATNALTGGGKPNVARAEGDIISGIGSSITSLIKAVVAVKNIVQAKEATLTGVGSTASAVLAALKSGCEAAVSIQKFINASVPPGLKSLIPGLGIAIAACEIIINAYTAYNADQAQSEMASVSGEFQTELTAVLGTEPLNVPKLFANEKRGKLGSRITYLRLKPGLYEALDAVMDRGITADMRRTREDNFRRNFGMKPTVNISQLAPAIKFYEMGSKMQEINQKRKVQGVRNIFTNVVAMAGEIAKFFPADGGITAGVLTGTAAAAGAAQSAGKFIQGLARNNGVLGGDSNRSSASKHKEYVSHTRSIYEFLDSIPKPVLAAHESKVKRGEQLLQATGVSTSIVYATDYGDNGAVNNQVKAIVEAMKAGR